MFLLEEKHRIALLLLMFEIGTIVTLKIHHTQKRNRTDKIVRKTSCSHNCIVIILATSHILVSTTLLTLVRIFR